MTTSDNAGHAVENVPYLLGQLGNVAVRQIKDALKPFHMHPRHSRTLMWLSAQPGISQQALGELLAVHRSAMVTMIDELEQGGLVTREPAENDRRAHALYLTDKGEAVIDEFLPVVQDYEEYFLRALEPAEAEQLLRILEKLCAAHGVTTPPPGRASAPC